MNLGRRSALNVLAIVMLMVPVWLAAEATTTEAIGSAATVARHRELASDRPAASLLALGFGLALAAHTMKRRDPVAPPQSN